MSDLVQRLRLAASDLTATMLDLRRIVVSPVLSAQQEATIRVLTDAAVEIERLWAEADEWAMRADGVVHNPHCTDDLPCLRCRAEQAERERDELRALLREAAAPSECAVCHAALLPTLEIPHCEDCIVTDDAAIDYEEASRDFVARLDAALAERAAGDLVARLRATWLADDDAWVATHWEGCEEDHWRCALARLCEEVERLRSQVEGYIKALHKAERERDEAIALLQEVREWHRCPWKHGASVEVIDLQLHAAWIARLDAALGGRDE